MGANSKIEWCDNTFNPWIGCTRVSAACDHCYAETLAHRHGWAEWGNHPRRRTSPSTWKQPLKWDREAEAAGTRARVFCASLADVFDNQAPEEWRDDLWDLMEQCAHLDWLLLTKRPQNIEKMLPRPRDARDWTDRGSRLSWPWPNVWLGTTVENQEEADRRIPHLLATPAAVHFLSCEPLLAEIDLSKWLAIERVVLSRGPHWTERIAAPEIDWVIVGGESGPHARPMHPDWARSLRDQCAAAGVAFFMKQWGEHLPLPGYAASGEYLIPQDTDVPSEIRHSHNLTGDQVWRRVGKKAAGRLLDGRTHDEFPEVSK